MGKGVFDIKKKLTTKLTLLILSLLFILLSVMSGLYLLILENSLKTQIEARALDMAKTLSQMPSVREAFETPDPSETLQPIAEKARKQSGAQYVVIGSVDSIRYAHPDPEKIGKRMVGGDNQRALKKGESYVSEAVGTLGAAVRGKAPIRTENGEIVGIISVGFLKENIQDIVYQYQTKLIFLLGFVVLMGVSGAVYISRNVKKSIFGLEPYEINQLYTEKQAITESVHEALIAINKHEEITLLNKKACELLGAESEDQWLGRPIAELLPDTLLPEVLKTKKAQKDQELTIGNEELIVNRVPIFEKESIRGAVASFRRKTDIDELSKKLAQTSQYAEGLRAQTHEYSNKLNTIAGLIQLESYTEALELIQKENKSHQDMLHFLIHSIPDPLLSGLLLGKINRAKELHINLEIDESSKIDALPPDMDQGKFITILGNLIENAFDAVSQKKERNILVFLSDGGDHILIEVEDSGDGIPDADTERIFQKFYSTKSATHRGLGLFLVKEAVNALNGEIKAGKSELGGALFTVVIPKKREVLGVER
ncbi:MULTISPECIES: ATP-binding protein [Bacillus]|uniref:ATP-binding protein n=1 Tax=Bacillus TaxID=1386 RepID=UPI0004030C40|nr:MULTISPECIES: sensor histidine kinase [Bacillus]QHZ46256.1 sensor histidine kinase [Bacillus sp. NSP9.1]WFA06479.1 sensor histidine kinase [Bacillus sp. HSf4]